MPSTILSNSNIQDSANGFIFDVVGSNGESYLAAVDNAAAYGQIDYNWNETYRVTAGLRWEDYKQLGIPWDPLEYNGCQISCDSNEILQSLFAEDDYYPTVSFTYMRAYFWAETFQFRLVSVKHWSAPICVRLRLPVIWIQSLAQSLAVTPMFDRLR